MFVILLSLEIEKDKRDNNRSNRFDNIEPYRRKLNSSISLWLERWFLSTNAKDIGVLYLIFSLFSGLLGTAFSVIIRMELSGPGVQYIADNQLYNSIITAHAILMIFFMVKKKFFHIFNFKSQPSLNIGKINSDNNDILITGKDNNNDDNKNSQIRLFSCLPFYTQKHSYEKGNQINKSIKYYSTLISQQQNKLEGIKSDLNSWWVTGFSDGEYNFTCKIVKSNSFKIGWSVQLCFQIRLHKKDKDLLKKIKSFYGVGGIYDQDEKGCNYMVQSLQDLKIIIDHFNKFPLLTQKRADFLLFLQIFNLMDKKEHLTISGLLKIVSIKASMNWGVS